MNTAARLQGVAPVDGGRGVGADVSADGAGVRVRGAGAGGGEGKDGAAGGLAAAAAHARTSAGRDPHAHDAARRQGARAVAADRDVRARGAAALVPAGDAGRGAGRGQEPAVRGAVRVTSRRGRGSSRWRQGRCLPYGDGIAFWALGEIVKAECGILESDTPEQAAGEARAGGRRRTTRSGPGCWPGWRRWSAPPAEPAAQEESFAAWRRFCEGSAADRADGARVRGSALGRPGAARVSRASGRLGGGRAAAAALHGAAGAVRAAPDLRRERAERAADQPRPADATRRRRSSSRRLLERAVLPAETQQAAAGAGRRQPAVRGGVRAPARRPRPARRAASRYPSRCRR